MSLVTVVPMAGLGTRFKQAGYKSHKALLPLPEGGTVLDKIIASIPDGALVTIGRRADRRELELSILLAAGAIENPNPRLAVRMLWVKETTSPAESLFEVRQFLGMDWREYVVCYCDCWLKGGLQPFVADARQSGRASSFVVFRSEEERFGKYAPGLAFGGIAWFRGSTLLNRLRSTIKSRRHAHEPGMPELFDFGKPDERHVYVADDYVDVGTPEAYQSYCGG